MTIYRGNNKINLIKIGNFTVSKVYWGTNIVYDTTPIPTDSLVGWWDGRDLDGSETYGTQYYLPTRVDPVPDSIASLRFTNGVEANPQLTAMMFNGGVTNNTYAQTYTNLVPIDYVNNKKFTVVITFKKTAVTTGIRYLAGSLQLSSVYPNYHIGVTQANGFVVGVKEMSINFGSVNLNEWNVGAITVDQSSKVSGQAKLTAYLNGASMTQSFTARTYYPPNDGFVSFNVGRSNGGSTYFPGEIGSLYIYRKVLTPEELDQIYQYELAFPRG